MKKSFKIGQKEYKYKKDAIAHYKRILNSYNFGQSLNESDFSDLNDLIDFSCLNYLAELEIDDDVNIDFKLENEVSEDEFDIEELKEDLELIIKDIKIARVQFNTKCFEVFYTNGESEYISYIMMINNQKYNPVHLFNKACRNSIQEDLIAVKQEYFDKNSIKGKVKCQETGQLSNWTELAIDHRQPHTFSIIVDRFKEVNKIDLEKIEYTSNEENQIIFKDESLIQEFIKYHKSKANLRIVRKECNLSRAGMARIKQTSKDLTIK